MRGGLGSVVGRRTSKTVTLTCDCGSHELSPEFKQKYGIRSLDGYLLGPHHLHIEVHFTSGETATAELRWEPSEKSADVANRACAAALQLIRKNGMENC